MTGSLISSSRKVNLTRMLLHRYTAFASGSEPSRASSASSNDSIVALHRAAAAAARAPPPPASSGPAPVMNATTTSSGRTLPSLDQLPQPGDRRRRPPSPRRCPRVSASSLMPSMISSSADAAARAVRLLHRLQRVVAVGRVADRQRLRDRVRLLRPDVHACCRPVRRRRSASSPAPGADIRVPRPVDQPEPRQLLDAPCRSSRTATPLAIGTMQWSGARQPSCSATS